MIRKNQKPKELKSIICFTHLFHFCQPGTDVASSPNSSQLHPTSGLQRQLVDEKIVGRCVPVHLDNLFAPGRAHQTRALDLKHIQDLKESFSKNPEQLVVLYGEVEECYTSEQLTTSGGAKVYVIGGNHTRVALQSLKENGLWGQITIQMTLYQGVSQDEALFLGVHHNTVHGFAKPMSFIEKVNLIRELGGKGFAKMTKKEKNNFYSSLMKVFDYETPTKARYNLKNHLALAKTNTEVWGLVQAVGDAWDRQAIVEQPRKKMIEQTFFKKLVHLSEETMINSLRTLMNEGYKAYLKTLKNNDGNDVLLPEDGTYDKPDQEDGYINEPDSQKEIHFVDDSSNEDDNREDSDSEIPLLKREMALMKPENERLTHENSKLKEELLAMRATNEMLRREKTALQARYNTLEEELDILKNGKGQEKTGLVGEPECKRPKRQTDKFTQGEEVDAFWQYEDGTEKWLRGKITKSYANGDYAVKYHDGVARVSSSWVKAPVL